MHIDPIELVAAVITAYSIWLATKENIWYYPTGVVALVLYTWLFFQARLYAESVLQVVCLGLLFYGWYKWLHGGEQTAELPVTKTPRWAWIAGLSCGLIGSAIVIAIQLRWTNNPSPYVDSSLFAWSLVAQWMTDRKWIENWIGWLLINTVSVPLYVSRHLWVTAILYVALWLLAVEGYRKWRKVLVAA